MMIEDLLITGPKQYHDIYDKPLLTNSMKVTKLRKMQVEQLKVESVWGETNEELIKIFDYLANDLFPGIKIMIAGGSARKALLGHELGTSDVDIFFTSLTDMQFAERRLKTLGIYPTSHPNCKQFTMATIYDGTFPSKESIPMQLITARPHESMEKLISYFDFTVCQFGYQDGSFFMTEQALLDEETKTLRKVETCDHEIKTVRFVKYMKYGYEPTEELYHEMFIDGRTELFEADDDFEIMDYEEHYGAF